MQPLIAQLKAEGHEWGVALVDTGDFREYNDAAESFYSEYGRALENIDILVVRPTVDKPLSDLDAETTRLQGFRDRVPRASLHLLYSNEFLIEISPNLNPAAQTPSVVDDTFLTWLRQTELCSFVHHSTALFKARRNFVYRSPSGVYCRAFLRVGNVQTSQHKLASFFFWMLPYLRDCDAILTETWSISSIALNTAYLLHRYDPNRSACRVDMLSSYHDGSPDLVPDMSEALRRVGGDGSRVLVLLSAVATGKSLRRLLETITRTQVDSDRFSYVALYRLRSEIPISSLCDLSDASEDEAMDFSSLDESFDRTTTTVIEIDRQTYFPLQILDSAIRIKESDTRPAKQFFNEYQGKGAISLHHDTHDLNGLVLRHHGINIDVEAMLQLKQFRKRLGKLLRQIPCAPALMIVPRHQAGVKLADFATTVLRDTFGKAPEILIHPDLHPQAADTPGPMISRLGESDAIVILDDVSATGQRLSRYQKHLRELDYHGRIFYVVGVARPSSEKEWVTRQRDLRYRSGRMHEAHEVLHAEKVILPDWNREECPWCREQEALRVICKDRQRLGRSYGLVVRRLNLLLKSAMQEGLIHNALWEGSSKLRLTSNSIFLQAHTPTGADVIAAVASTLQRMRTADGDDKLEESYPHIVVIDSDDYLGKTFNDVILPLAIVRAAQRRELERWSDNAEEERRHKVHEHLLRRDVERDAICLEFAVAMLDQKIPRPKLSRSDWEELDPLEYGPFLRRIIGD